MGLWNTAKKFGKTALSTNPITAPAVAGIEYGRGKRSGKDLALSAALPSKEAYSSLKDAPSDLFGMGGKSPSPRGVYYGGSQENLENLKLQMDSERALASGYANQAGQRMDPTSMASFQGQGAAAGALGLQGGRLAAQGNTRLGVGAYNSDQAMGLLSGAASGMAPSAAEAQLRANAAEIIKQQQSMAAAARGGQAAGALRTAMASGSEAQAQAGMQAAMLRAQEMQAARNAYAQAAAQQYQLGLGASQLGSQATGASAGISAQQTGQLMGYQDAQQQLNAGREMAYLGAGNDIRNAQLNADMNMEMARLGAANAKYAANSQMIGSGLAAGGTILGAMYGGPAGAAAGGAAARGIANKGGGGGGTNYGLGGYSSQLQGPSDELQNYTPY